jgi:hypothetical protein
MAEPHRFILIYVPTTGIPTRDGERQWRPYQVHRDFNALPQGAEETEQHGLPEIPPV